MRRRLVVGLGLVMAVGLGVALLIPASRFRLLGLLRGEAFFEGRPTSYWVSALRKEDTFLGGDGPPRDVGKVLREGGADAVPVLVQMLRHEDEGVRFQGVLALCVLQPGPAAAAPALAERLHQEDDWNCLRLLTELLLRLDRPAGVAALVGALQRNPTASGRAWAAEALGQLGSEVRETARALGEALDDEDAYVQVHAAKALWKVSGQAGPSLPTLVQGLRAPNPAARTSAEVTLKQMGPEATAAVPRLVEALRHGEADIRARAATCLGKIGPAQEALRHLIDALADPAPQVRSAAAGALPGDDPRVVGALPRLIEGLRDNKVRWAAAAALGRIGPRARAAVPALVEALQDRNLLFRSVAATALKQVDPKALAQTGYEAENK